MRAALWLVPILFVLVAGLGIWWLLRLLTVPTALAAAGQSLLYLLPIGTWGTQLLTEGPVLAGVVAAMVGAILLVDGRMRGGVALLALGLLWTALVKYSTALVLAAALVAAAVLIARTTGHRTGLLALGTVSLTAAGLVVLASWRLGLPGSADTVQELFTRHFTRPDVTDLWPRLLGANARYWLGWLHLVPSNPLLLAGFLVGGWALWRWHRQAAPVVVATGLVGAALAVAHPDVNAYDRIYVLLWLPVVVGVPVALWRLALTRPTISFGGDGVSGDRPAPRPR